MTFELIALLCTAFFASACVYVSFVEQPARLACSTDAAITEWRTSFKRAAMMQIGLVVIGALAAVAAVVAGQGPLVLLGGLLLVLMFPYTLIVIMPVNRLLLDTTRPVDATTDALLRKWGRLHHGRTVGSLAALAILTIDILLRIA
jgi:uncharacterized membrane protein